MLVWQAGRRAGCGPGVTFSHGDVPQDWGELQPRPASCGEITRLLLFALQLKRKRHPEDPEEIKKTLCMK